MTPAQAIRENLHAKLFEAPLAALVGHALSNCIRQRFASRWIARACHLPSLLERCAHMVRRWHLPPSNEDSGLGKKDIAEEGKVLTVLLQRCGGGVGQGTLHLCARMAPKSRPQMQHRSGISRRSVDTRLHKHRCKSSEISSHEMWKSIAEWFLPRHSKQRGEWHSGKGIEPLQNAPRAKRRLLAQCNLGPPACDLCPEKFAHISQQHLRL
mmetsp:Transcript_52497/g.139787  ORF Transcript_52497/g.139787 Transcript_52497/m.139787 type:complete len:211 (+) Transcript_52497:389-1021(+)